MYDVIIIGSGPAGLTAAIYTTRADLKTLVVAGLKWGGQLQLTTDVENFPGFPEGIQGPELMMQMRKQAERFGAEFIPADLPETDLSNQSGGPFTITVEGKTYQGKALLIASGADAKTLDVPGEKELSGHGVSYCATCDGAFFKNKKIIVAGGGDSAMEEACFLTRFAESVTVVHRRDTLRASQIMQSRAKENPKLKFLLNTQILEILGEGKVEKVKVKSIKGGRGKGEGESKIEDSLLLKERGGQVISETDEEIVWEFPIDGVFVAIGHVPNTKIFKGLELDEHNYVKAQEGTRTNIEGVFVSGDVEDERYRQAVTAAGFGCQAALDIERWLRDKQ